MIENHTIFENKKKTRLALAFVPTSFAIFYIAYTFDHRIIVYLLGTVLFVVGLVIGLYQESIKLDFLKREFIFQKCFAGIVLENVRDSFDNITKIVVVEDKIRNLFDFETPTEDPVWKLGFTYSYVDGTRFFSLKWFETKAEADQNSKLLSLRMGVINGPGNKG